MEIDVNICNEHKYPDLYKEYKSVKEELEQLFESRQDLFEKKIITDFY